MNKTLQQERDFLLLIESHKRVIYKVCYMYATDKEQLDDLYQEIVMNLWRAYPSFRGESSSATWIYRVSLNTCISYRRKSKLQIQAVTLPVDFEAFDEEDGKTSQLRELYPADTRTQSAGTGAHPTLARGKKLRRNSPDNGYFEEQWRCPSEPHP